MGTSVTIIVPAGSADAVALARSLFEDWDARLSRFRLDSELSALNASAGLETRVSPLLYEVVEQALHAAASTDGAFDPLILPRLIALGYDRTFVEVLAGQNPAPAAGAVPAGPAGATWQPGRWREVRLDPERRTIRLPSGGAIDPGGIAKGMAVDAALERIVDRVGGPAAVEAGGDLAVAGLPEDAAGWTVQLDDPPGEPVGIEGGALATSSTRRRRWTRDGIERHHIVDPRTGEPAASGVRSVTVVAGGLPRGGRRGDRGTRARAHRRPRPARSHRREWPARPRRRSNDPVGEWAGEAPAGLAPEPGGYETA